LDKALYTNAGGGAVSPVSQFDVALAVHGGGAPGSDVSTRGGTLAVRHATSLERENAGLSFLRATDGDAGGRCGGGRGCGSIGPGGRRV